MTTQEQTKSKQPTTVKELEKMARPHKVDKYHEFILWFAMPTIERTRLGIDTQTAFADYYSVGEATLWRWKNRPDFEARVDHIQMQWGKEKTADVIQGIYRSAVKGNPMSQLLWLQYFKKFTPKTQVETTVKHEIGVGDIRFLIEQLPNELKQKHYGNLRELLDDASAVRNALESEDSDWSTRPPQAISDEADNDAQDVSGETTDEVPQSNKTSLRADMVGELLSYHNKSTAWWGQKQVTRDGGI